MPMHTVHVGVPTGLWRGCVLGEVSESRLYSQIFAAVTTSVGAACYLVCMISVAWCACSCLQVHRMQIFSSFPLSTKRGVGECIDFTVLSI